MSESFDVVVIGSGSGGGTVVDRLTEDERCTVLLLEAGPDFPDEATAPPSFYGGGAHMGAVGAGLGRLLPGLDWGLWSEELPGGRRAPLARGRLMGGSSMTNGCVAVRPRPSDMDAWVAAGGDAWSWSSLLPRFEDVERELSVQRYPDSLFLPVQRLMAEAFQEIGFRWVEDLNAPDAWDGVVGPWPRNRRNEVRQGSLNTYIRRARPRANLTIRGDALVDRLLLAGERVTGVRYVDAGGRPQEVAGDRVVLAAGAYGSPAVLLRSGVGPADELAALGIEAVADLPVGRRLLDHPGIDFTAIVDPEVARMGWPAFAVAARGDHYWAIPMGLDQEEGRVGLAMFINITSEIDGRITLASADPRATPLIDHGYAGTVDAGLYEPLFDDAERIFATDAVRAAGGAPGVVPSGRREHALATLRTGAHPAGGCAIGTVVDGDLSVLGLEGVTVADASVFPAHVTNNPNLTVHVVGEVAAARLREAVR